MTQEQSCTMSLLKQRVSTCVPAATGRKCALFIREIRMKNICKQISSRQTSCIRSKHAIRFAFAGVVFVLSLPEIPQQIRGVAAAVGITDAEWHGWNYLGVIAALFIMALSIHPICQWTTRKAFSLVSSSRLETFKLPDLTYAFITLVLFAILFLGVLPPILWKHSPHFVPLFTVMYFFIGILLCHDIVLAIIRDRSVRLRFWDLSCLAIGLMSCSIPKVMRHLVEHVAT